MFRLVPIGGLGNRLRMILSHRAKYGRIEVLWARSAAVCRERFLDVFYPLHGCEFTDIGEIHAHDYRGPHDEMWAQIARDAPIGWIAGYNDLLPRSHIRDRIDRLRHEAIVAPYSAMHVRRGDHVAHAAKFGGSTTNEEFLGWAEHMHAERYYLATDCSETQRWFEARLPVVTSLASSLSGTTLYEHRSGTLSDAVTDMYMCASAESFMGSWFSSFSETICILRGEVKPEHFDPHLHMPSQDESYRCAP